MHHSISYLTVGAILVATASAPTVYQSSPPRRTVEERDWGPWLGPFRHKLVPSLMQDFGEQYLYAEADRLLPPPRGGERRVVFLGDSITDRWDLGRFFPGQPFVNRGIGSQVTAQMVLRFQADVVALRPSAVMILAGVNDIQGFLQAPDLQGIERNYRAMADMADAHGIKVVFASVLPVSNYEPGAAMVTDERDPAKIRALNAWLHAFCRARGYAYADYHGALADDADLFRRGLSEDGVHPRAAAYAIMAPIAAAAIAQVLNAAP